MRYLKQHYSVPDDFYSGLTDSELAALESCSDSDFIGLVTDLMKARSVYRQPLEAKFDFSDIDFFYLNHYSPSVLAFRSFLYLQALIQARFGPHYFTTRSKLHSFLLIQTISGAGILTYQGGTYELYGGDTFLIDCRKLHDYRTLSPEGWHYRLVHFSGSMMPDIFEQILLNRNVKFHFNEDSLFTKKLIELFDLNETEKPENEVRSNTLLHRMLEEILVTLPQFNTLRMPLQFQEISEYISQNSCENISLDEISDHFNISKYHLSRQFKKYTGQTILNRIIRERLKRAKEFLRYTDFPMNDISENIGYENVSHFSRMFREHEKMTPSEYRRLWKV